MQSHVMPNLYTLSNFFKISGVTRNRTMYALYAGDHILKHLLFHLLGVPLPCITALLLPTLQGSCLILFWANIPSS